MNKTIRDMTALEFLDIMDEIQDYCTGINGCYRCILRDTCTHSLSPYPEDWDVVGLKKMVKEYLEEMK